MSMWRGVYKEERLTSEVGGKRGGEGSCYEDYCEEKIKCWIWEYSINMINIKINIAFIK